MSQRDYSQGKIYKLVSKDLSHDLVYIGSTCLDLRKRLAKHKGDWRTWKNGGSCYVKSYNLYEKGEVDIVLIETVNANTKAELHARERYHIENTKCVNKYVPGRTNKEYRQDHKDEIKKYREDRKDEIKKYREDHKDEIKKYREDHKDEIKKTKKKPFKCECGATVQTSNKSYHLKSKKHIDFTKKNQNVISV